MRLLKFLAVFLITAVIIIGFVMGWNWKSFNVFFENRDAMTEGIEWVPKTQSLRGLSEFIAENPELVSLESRVLGTADSTLSFEAGTPRIMGATSNIFILIAYSAGFDSGTYSETDRIEWESVAQYQLPDVEESLHEETLEAARGRGWIEDGTLSLENALKLLAEFNDLALADCLWWKLSPGVWDELPSLLDLQQTDMPLPFSGLYLAISPGLHDTETSGIIRQWESASRDEWRYHVAGLSRGYAGDPDRNTEIREYMEDNRLGNTFTEERNAMDLFPKTTTRDMVRVLEKLVSGEILNPAVSNRVMEWMRWPMEQQRGIENDFSDYGALYDNRMGLLNGINFGTSAYTGDTTVQAVFFDHLPVAFWFHASGNHMHQDLLQRLIYDPAMIEQMQQLIHE